MMPSFVAAAAVLLALALAIGLRPLFHREAQREVSASALNVSVYREQLVELERDLAAGLVTREAHDEAKREIQQRLLGDVSTDESPIMPAHAPRRALIALLVMLPLAAVALYAWLGNPAALQPPEQHGYTQAEVEQMVAKLAARMEADPSDPKGWAILARTYRAMGRLDEAEKAYGHLQAAMQTDPALLADYAELLATRANGDFSGKPRELLAQALKLDPQYPEALALAGTDAFERRDYAQAVAYWERLLPQMPPGTEEAAALRATIAKARERMAGGSGAVAANATVSGRVELAKELAGRADPNDTLFIFARAVDGPPMPLAVLRIKASELPKSFTLDDSMAMAPAMRISTAKRVRIEARISKSGRAEPQPGDLVGASDPVSPGAEDVLVRIGRVVQ